MKLAEEIAIGWRITVSQACPQFPARVVQQAFEFVLQVDSAVFGTRVVSWVELVVSLLQASAAEFPAKHPVSGHWVDATEVPLILTRHTFAVQLRVFRHVLRRGMQALQLDHLFAEHIDLSSLGICFSLDGMRVGISDDALGAARAAIFKFCAGRSVRTVGALARPFLLD